MLYVPSSLRLFHALFVCLDIFLGWICAPAETFHFPWTIKDTTNVYEDQKTAVKPFKRGNFLCIFKSALEGLRQFLITESSLKMIKNAFYFTLKALFILKIFTFLS